MRCNLSDVCRNSNLHHARGRPHHDLCASIVVLILRQDFHHDTKVHIQNHEIDALSTAETVGEPTGEELSQKLPNT